MRSQVLRILALVLGMYAVSFAAPETQPTSRVPATAKTTEEIVKVVEPRQGPGLLQSVLFNRGGRQVFALWYCPFSGRGDFCVHAYYFDYEKGIWIRFIDRLIPNPGDLSPEMPAFGAEIIFRDSEDKVIVRESTAAFPSSLEADHPATPTTQP